MQLDLMGQENAESAGSRQLSGQSGLFDKLESMGIQDGDIVSLYDLEFEYQR